jgi:hypothetical protein
MADALVSTVEDGLVLVDIVLGSCELVELNADDTSLFDERASLTEVLALDVESNPFELVTCVESVVDC